MALRVHGEAIDIAVAAGDIVSQASRIFPRTHARSGGGRGKGRKNTSGDYCTVFVSNGNVISAFGHAIIT